MKEEVQAGEGFFEVDGAPEISQTLLGCIIFIPQQNEDSLAVTVTLGGNLMDRRLFGTSRVLDSAESIRRGGEKNTLLGGFYSLWPTLCHQPSSICHGPATLEHSRGPVWWGAGLGVCVGGWVLHFSCVALKQDVNFIVHRAGSCSRRGCWWRDVISCGFGFDA